MATYLGFPFDAEVFLYTWAQQKDTVLDSILKSGAMVNDSQIATLISGGSDVYTLPFYKLLPDSEVNYDGATNITTQTTDGSSQSGIVFGRASAWTSKDFVIDYNSGANPMNQIIAQVDHKLAVARQKRLLGILGAVFGITGNSEWTLHTHNIATTTTTVAEANLMAVTTGNTAMQKALGDAKDNFSLAIMHSVVATNLENKQVLEYWKYTDANGIQRKMNIANWGALTVIVNDSVPATTNATATGYKDYTTYILGAGALRFASAPVKKPVSVAVDEFTNGGQESLIVRYRETIHPYGFSFTKPGAGYTSSPTDVQLFASANWSIVDLPKNIPLCRIITNG